VKPVEMDALMKLVADRVAAAGQVSSGA
jgi:hypothetical protein